MVFLIKCGGKEELVCQKAGGKSIARDWKHEASSTKSEFILIYSNHSDSG